MNIDVLVQHAEQFGAEFGPKALGAIVIFFLGWWLAKGLTAFTRHAMVRARLDPTLSKFAANLVFFGTMTFVAVAAVNKLGVQTTSFIAILGAAGLAVGLALQGSLSNLATGVMIILFRPYKVGDYIEAAGVAGTVEEVQIFTTVLKSPDNKRIIVPNSHVMGNTIVNYSTMSQRRIDLTVGVGYDVDLDKTRQVLMDILTQDDRVLDDPAPVIGITALAESSVNFVVRPWTESSNYWPLYYDLNERIKKRFDAEGISIPFPQRDVHVYERKLA